MRMAFSPSVPTELPTEVELADIFGSVNADQTRALTTWCKPAAATAVKRQPATTNARAGALFGCVNRASDVGAATSRRFSAVSEPSVMSERSRSGLLQ